MEEGLDRTPSSPGRGLIVGGVGVCTLFGFLSKANGALLPLLVAIVEWTFIRSQQQAVEQSPILSRCFATTILPACIAVLAYLLYEALHGMLFGIQASRPWTLGQRLLSEPRVLIDYLVVLVAPRPYSIGLFNDSVVASRDLFHPWTTLPAIVAIAGLIPLAVRQRKHSSVLSLAILFFFAGHLMESSSLALESSISNTATMFPRCCWHGCWRDGSPGRPICALRGPILAIGVCCSCRNGSPLVRC